jgi:hypothetical protein
MAFKSDRHRKWYFANKNKGTLPQGYFGKSREGWIPKEFYKKSSMLATPGGILSRDIPRH